MLCTGIDKWARRIDHHIHVGQFNYVQIHAHYITSKLCVIIDFPLEIFDFLYRIFFFVLHLQLEQT